MSNIFLTLPMLISVSDISEKEPVPFLLFTCIAFSVADGVAHDNRTVVLGLEAMLDGRDFKGLLLGDGANNKQEFHKYSI